MFNKVIYKLPVSPTNRDEVAKAELTVRHNQYKTPELFRKYLHGCENAFIARTSPSLKVRRGRTIICYYGISPADMIGVNHFNNDMMACDSMILLRVTG